MIKHSASKIFSTLKVFWKPLATIFFWGNSFIATKYALEFLNPLTIIFLRMIIAVFFLSIVALYTKRSFSLNLRDHGGIFLLALIATLHLWIQVEGLNYTSAANTGWIIGFSPVFIVIIGFLWLKEKLMMQQLIGILIAFGGLVLLVSKGHITSISFISNKGDFLVLGSTLTWAVYSIVGKKITVNYPPIMTILFQFLFMAIIISPFTINSQNFEAVTALAPNYWFAILFLGIFCSGIAYVLWAQSLTEMPAYKVGAFLYIQPFITFFSAWFLLAEEITIITLISGLIIISGVVLVNRK